jgi:peroxiredoxin
MQVKSFWAAVRRAWALKEWGRVSRHETGAAAAKARFDPGDVISRLLLTAAGGEEAQIPDAMRLVHLQFRRFAGCAFCNLHLRSFEARHDEIAAAGVREVVVFRSTAEQLQRDPGEVPYAIILDPDGRLYDRFGVGSGLRSVLDPRAALMALPNLVRSFLSGRRIGLPAEGGRVEGLLGFPADFLIGTDGRIIACDYGDHADDGWSVDELLALARRREFRS